MATSRLTGAVEGMRSGESGQVSGHVGAMPATTSELVIGLEALMNHAGALDSLLTVTHAPATARWLPVVTWMRHNPTQTPWSVLVRRDGEVVAAALLVRVFRRGVYRFETPCEGHLPSWLPSRDAHSAKALAVALARSLRAIRNPWVLHLRYLELADPAVAAITEELAVTDSDNGVSPRINFSSGEPLTAYLSHNTRSALAKAHNRIKNAGLAIEMRWTREPEEIDAIVPEILRLYRKRSSQLGHDVAVLEKVEMAGIPEVSVVEVRRKAVDEASWDDWAQRCGGSVRSSLSHARGWSVRHSLKSRLRLFELYIADGARVRKMGQFILSDSTREKIFLDRIQLLPADSGLWVEAMASILKAVGSGAYRYGWELNLEEPREEYFRKIPGVVVDSVRSITVEAVDFSQWDTWEAYLRGTSNNIRRNAKKALTEFPDLALVSSRGLRSVRQIPSLIQLRSSMYRRKGISFRAVQAATSTLGHTLSSPDYVFTVLAVGAGKAQAAFNGSAFGSNTYYTDGGSRADNNGAAWYLMIEMLKQAYNRAPDGKFIMGYVDHSTHDESIGGGLLRARRSCRVTDYETSVVWFRWSAATGA
jgi:hypothetical protein